MNYLRGFIPWIAFAVVASAGWQWGALAALAIAVAMLIVQRRAGVGFDALILEIGTVVYFVALASLAFANPNSGLHHYTAVMSFGWLALISWGTLAIRRPFTEGIARRSVAEEIWQSPVFKRVNVVLTMVWATAFTATGIAIAICVATGAGSTASTVCQVVGFVLPAAFTARYPKAVRARYAR